MIAALETWLRKATRHLSRDSAAQVRTEIQQHYELAREAGMDGGASAGDAERLAITGLGDARAANRQYRGVLLTSAEASLLRECAWEARAVCSRKWQLLAIPVMALFASANFFLADSIAIARAIGCRDRNGACVCDALPAGVYTIPQPGIPARKVGCPDQHPGICILARPAQMALAAGLVCLASALDRMDADFDSTETARCGVAQTAVSLTRTIATTITTRGVTTFATHFARRRLFRPGAPQNLLRRFDPCYRK